MIMNKTNRLVIIGKWRVDNVIFLTLLVFFFFTSSSEETGFFFVTFPLVTGFCTAGLTDGAKKRLISCVHTQYVNLLTQLYQHTEFQNFCKTSYSDYTGQICIILTSLEFCQQNAKLFRDNGAQGKPRIPSTHV